MLPGYIAAKSRLSTQREYTWARHSFLYNIAYGTWPTEWHQIMIKMAYSEWQNLGQKTILSRHRSRLLQNTMASYAANTSTGLVTKSTSSPLRDIVDWPQNSRDGFNMTAVNTVVNAYAAQTTRMLAELGIADQVSVSESIVKAMDRYLFDAARGRYCDGVCATTNHTALHASAFPLAFDLVPSERVATAVAWVRKRGM